MSKKTEKVCPSCGAVIEGGFCTECGEVIEDESMTVTLTGEEIATERATTNEENILIAMGGKWLNNLCGKDRHCYLVEKSEKQ